MPPQSNIRENVARIKSEVDTLEKEIISLEMIENDEDRRRKIHDIRIKCYAIKDRIMEAEDLLIGLKLFKL